MQEAEKKDFWQLVICALDVYRQTPTSFVLDTWWTACKDYDSQQVKSAIEQWCANPETGQWPPKPADIAAVLQKGDKAEGRARPRRLGGNEAWAIAMTCVDERKTVVWTNEIASAWDIARPVLDMGDKVGARMAFLESYDRITKTNEHADITPKIEISYGWDASSRANALKSDTAQMLLATQDKPQQDMLLIAHDAQNIQGENAVSPKLGEFLAQLRQKWKQEKEQAEQSRYGALMQERDDWQAKKQQQEQKMQEYMQQQSCTSECTNGIKGAEA